ncbi:SagB-type dehydrogenase domain-containing protein [Anaerocolumna xylanovorans DSM 12503]|uniref:SagB-type dehydrogenase domain-containing protein n=2 Tax=Anaerocolumna TaxID=1843210 RepID=A0A1M7YIG8_9FIRM|nr:SagB-type dehydrogenase domain-containing protein [Anaerocolumna xylanovorans DSM 12503]
MVEAGTIIFWSYSVQWKYDKKNLIISGLNYDLYLSLFPGFYIYTVDGIRYDQLLRSFEEDERDLAEELIKKLMEKNVLVTNVMGIHELFDPQQKYFMPHNNYDEEMMFDASKVEDFKRQAQQRNDKREENEIALPAYDWDAEKSRRESIRSFSNNCISSKDFAYVLNGLRQKKIPDNKRRYCYPSAGGLYPIDCYLYVKENIVEGIGGGLYFYSPANHSLRLLDKILIPKTIHYLNNREIYSSSAFSIYFVYNPCFSMPKYGGMGYYYAILDTGIMMQLLTMQALERNIGSCIIGDLNSKKLKEYMKLASGQIYLGCMEMGYYESK